MGPGPLCVALGGPRPGIRPSSRNSTGGAGGTRDGRRPVGLTGVDEEIGGSKEGNSKLMGVEGCSDVHTSSGGLPVVPGISLCPGLVSLRGCVVRGGLGGFQCTRSVGNRVLERSLQTDRSETTVGIQTGSFVCRSREGLVRFPLRVRVLFLHIPRGRLSGVVLRTLFLYRCGGTTFGIVAPIDGLV